MELTPSLKAASSVTQEFHNISWNPKVQYRTQKNPPLIPILIQMNAIHTTRSYFSEINLNKPTRT
jgi:hypothetical protein